MLVIFIPMLTVAKGVIVIYVGDYLKINPPYTLLTYDYTRPWTNTIRWNFIFMTCFFYTLITYPLLYIFTRLRD